MTLNYQAINFAAIESSADYISMYDQQLVICQWNAAAANRFFISSIDAIGRSLSDFFDHLEDDFRILCYKESLADGKTFFFTKVSFELTTGKYCHLVIPIFQDKKITHVLSVMREIYGDEIYTQADLIQPLLVKQS